MTALTMLSATSTVASDTVTLRRPGVNPYSNFAAQALQLAYRDLGFNVQFIDMPGKRELIAADQGEIWGVLARIPETPIDYPNLVRLDFPLFPFSLQLVTRRNFCGNCSNEQIRQIAYVSGAMLARHYAEQQHWQAVPFIDHQALLTMLDKNRVDAALLVNFEIPDTIAMSDQYMIRTVQESVDYHFVNKAFADVLPRLQQSLERLELDGTLANLRTLYNVPVRIKPELTAQN